MFVRKCLYFIATNRIPQFPGVRGHTIHTHFKLSPSLPLFLSYTVKSAAPVAAFVASLLRQAPHTAPLCPRNVPTQSPVSPCRNIGLPSIERDSMMVYIVSTMVCI